MAATPTTKRKELNLLADKAKWVRGGLTFELSGRAPGWCLAREADAKPESLAGQVPCRCESAPAKG
jgi:hypothetical protein